MQLCMMPPPNINKVMAVHKGREGRRPVARPKRLTIATEPIAVRIDESIKMTTQDGGNVGSTKGGSDAKDSSPGRFRFGP